MSDDSPLPKVEESFGTENVVVSVDEACEETSIKQEVNPFDDEEMNEPKEEIDSDSSSSHSNDNFEPMPPDAQETDSEDERPLKPPTSSSTVVASAVVTLPDPSKTTDEIPIKTESTEQVKDQTEL